MSRQIYKSTTTVRSGKDPQVSEQREIYGDRLLKLIPGESVAAYLTLKGIIASALQNEPETLTAWLWAIFGILLIGNFLYLRKSVGVVDMLQLLLLSLAFVTWVITIGGPFDTIPAYRPFMGSVLLVLFTFFVPLYYTGKELEE